MTPDAPIRHHYTPQFYLSAWCTPGGVGEGNRLWVVQNIEGRITYMRRAPKAIGFQDHLYSFSEDLPENERGAIEREFLSPLDNKGRVLVDKLVADERLDGEERTVWAMFIAAMRARTPDNISMIRDRGAEHARLELGRGQGEYEALREDDDPATLLEWIEARQPGLIQNFSLAALPRLLTGEIVVKIKKMAWHSLDFADGRHRLLSSDRPCVFTTGIDDPNCIIALPLSPRHAFISFYPGSQAQAALMTHGPSEIGAALNKNVVTQAKERAYCQGKADAPERFYSKYLSSVAAYRR